MKSTYAAGNDDIYAGFETDFEVTKERAFFDWMQRQKTYFGELMGQQQKAEFERAFEMADNVQRREMLEALRQLSAVAQPELLKSVSHREHCLMAKTENPELTAMTSQMVKVKTLGVAPPRIRNEDLPLPGERMPPDAFRGGNNTARPPPQRPATASLVDLKFTSPTAKHQPLASDSSRPGSAAGFYPRGARPGTPSQAAAFSERMSRPLSAMAERQQHVSGVGRQRAASAAGSTRGGGPRLQSRRRSRSRHFRAR